MSDLPADVLAWAALHGPARVLAVTRERWEKGTRGPGVVLSADAIESERREIGRLVGMDWQISDKPLRLGVLRRSLRLAGVDLADLLEAVGGPLRDLPAERAAAAVAAVAAEEKVRQVLVDAGVREDVTRLAMAGRWLGSPSTGYEQAQRVATVLRRLPAPEGTLLAQLAAETVGDPHALDRRFTLGGAVLRIHEATRTGADPGPTRDAFGRRWAWSRVGVTYDRVSSVVLVLNLPLPAPADGGPGATAARLCSVAAGEPLWLTYRMLPPDLRLPDGSMRGRMIRVCENPSVVEAAADRLGAASHPLVCTFGQVSVTGVSLLSALARAGAQFLLSGDRDPPGVVITDGLLARLPGSQVWLPDVPGLFEEDRLNALLSDLAPRNS